MKAKILDVSFSRHFIGLNDLSGVSRLLYGYSLCLSVSSIASYRPDIERYSSDIDR